MGFIQLYENGLDVVVELALLFALFDSAHCATDFGGMLGGMRTAVAVTATDTLDVHPLLGMAVTVTLGHDHARLLL